MRPLSSPVDVIARVEHEASRSAWLCEHRDGRSIEVPNFLFDSVFDPKRQVDLEALRIHTASGGDQVFWSTAAVDQRRVHRGHARGVWQLHGRVQWRARDGRIHAAHIHHRSIREASLLRLEHFRLLQFATLVVDLPFARLPAGFVHAFIPQLAILVVALPRPDLLAALERPCL